MSIDQQFIEFIVKGIVGNPDDVRIDRTIDEKGVLLELHVNPEDLGRVIGKRGNTAQSMRTLLRALGTKNDARYNLKIIDDGSPKPEKKEQPEKEEQPKQEDNQRAESANDAVSEPVTNDKPEPETAGAGQWAHLKSSADQANDDADSTDDEEESSTSSTSNRLEEAKKDLADLDDLNI